MKNANLTLRTVFLAAFLAAPAAFAAVPVGGMAPPLELQGSDGKKHSIASAKGKWVVLEWLNHGCPYVKKHYVSGNMQALQAKYTAKGVVWYSVISSAPGKQGHGEVAPEPKAAKSAATAVLFDPEGTVGRAYGATTTPHMFVINPQGKVVYQGAIDDKPTTDAADIAGAKNYVAAALDTALDPKLGESKIEKASEKPYGCSIKYKN